MSAWIALVVVLVLLVLLAAVGMRRGWRGRAARQAATVPRFPRPPESGWEATPVLAPASGVYVGTTFARDWQDRVALGDVGLRSAAEFRLTPGGLLVDRTGASPLWIAAGALVGARTASALAGKVMGGAGLLVVRWRHGGQEFDTGLRGDDRSAYPAWIAAVAALAGGVGREPGDGATEGRRQ